MYNAKIIGEESTIKATTPFSTTYDMSGKSWYIDLKDGGTYTSVINLTGKEVVKGHENEVQANSIEFEALATLTVKFDLSTDGLNWVPVVPAVSITGRSRFNFEPTWALFLRVVISGTGVVGARNLFVHKLTYAESAVFQTTLIQPGTAFSALAFEPKAKLPNGTSIEHYIVNSSTPDGVGTRIEPGLVSTQHNVQTTITPPASSFSLDTIPNLYTYTLDSTYNPIIETAQLYRGYQQWMASAVDYSWLIQGDQYHIPQLADWGTMEGTTQQVYMSCYPVVGAGASWLPSGLIATSGTIISTYSGTDSWTVFDFSSGSTLMVKPNYNYRFTTKVYMDRDVVLENGAAGIFANASPGTTLQGFGWAIYLNGNRLAADNNVYTMSSLPSTGSLSSSQGKNFQWTLIQGWNTIDVLVCVPSNMTTTLLSGCAVGLFVRPDLFTIELPNTSIATGDAPMSAYPLWAESEPLRRVSEFYLKAITPPWNKGDWAFRLSSRGEPTSVLLNYSPSILQTLDGKLKGSDQAFYLKSYTDYGDNPGFYYRAVLRRASTAGTTPSLTGYRFSTMRK